MFRNLCLLGEGFNDLVEGGDEGLLDCSAGHGWMCLRGYFLFFKSSVSILTFKSERF